jgi:hypothetical protein
MTLHGGFGNPQFDSDLLVAHTVDDQIEDFAFAGAQVGVGHTRRESARNGCGKKPPSGVDAAQRIHQRLMRHSLDDVAARACLQRLVDVLIAFVRGQNDKLRFAMPGDHRANRIYPAYARQPQIHEGDVRKVRFKKFNCLFATACLGHGGHVGRGIDNCRDADPHDGVVVYNEYSNLRCFSHCCVLVHRCPPACMTYRCLVTTELMGAGHIECRYYRKHVPFVIEEAASAQSTLCGWFPPEDALA